MNVKQVILLCVVFSFLGYGVSYVFPHNQAVKVTPLIERPYVSPLPSQVEEEMNIISEVEPSATSVAKITKTKPKPTLKMPVVSFNFSEYIRPGIYNKGERDYDNYLLPTFKHMNNEKYQVQARNLLADATYDTKYNEFPTIKVYEPEYDDDSIYQNNKESTLAHFDSPKFATLFGGYDVEFSYEIMDIFSTGFSDKVDEIFEVNCRELFCVLFAKLNGPLDLEARIELREEITIKVDEVANLKGFALYFNGPSEEPTSSFSYKKSDYNLELRVSIRFGPLPTSD